MTPLLKGFTAATRLPDRRKPWQWCEEHVVVDNTSPMPGRWRSDSSPWVKELMEVFPDNRVTDVSVMCSAQSSKTQTLLNCSCWAISEDPGPAMWVMAAKDEAKTFVRDRVKPTFDGCQPVSGQMLSAEAYEFTFASMPFYFTGAGSPSKLQSKPIRWLFLDEVRNYPPGALDTVLKRTRAFWNSRRVLISTPDKKNDAVHRAFLAGDQRVFHIACPSCGQLQPLKFEQLKAMHPETGQACKFHEVPGVREDVGSARGSRAVSGGSPDTSTTEASAGGRNLHAGGVCSAQSQAPSRWNFDLLAEWIRYQCVACGHLIADTPAERKALARNGRFVRMNPKAPRHRVSFHWNALLPPWVSWRSIVEEFIAARAAARNGDLDPLKTFVNETLGEPWEDQLGEIDDYDFLESRKGDYDFDEPWAEERVRFMAADKQEAGGEHYWWVVRAFGLFGRSRLVAYGRCNTKEELEELRRTYRVKAVNCMIDAAFKASEVYRFCLATGWKAFKGDDADYFLQTDPRTKRTFRQIWIRNWADPHYGTKMAGRTKPIPLFRWSNNAAKDMLTEMMQGLVGDWTLPRRIGSDYLKQATAERREEKEDSKGRISFFWKQVRRDNHLRDCELMILVAAVITKIVQSGSKGIFVN